MSSWDWNVPDTNQLNCPNCKALAAQLAEARLEIDTRAKPTVANLRERIERLERALAYAKKRLSRSIKDLALVEIERLERGE